MYDDGCMMFVMMSVCFYLVLKERVPLRLKRTGSVLVTNSLKEMDFWSVDRGFV
jgi:hypothetical protein